MSILCRTFVVFWDTKQRATKSKEEGEGKRTLHGGLGVFREADSGLLQNQWKLVPRVKTDLCGKSLLAPHQASTYFVSRTFTNDQ